MNALEYVVIPRLEVSSVSAASVFHPKMLSGVSTLVSLESRLVNRSSSLLKVDWWVDPRPFPFVDIFCSIFLMSVNSMLSQCLEIRLPKSWWT